MYQDISLLHRFKNSVEILATGKGDIRSRLKDVYVLLCPIKANDLPKELQNDWIYIENHLTKFKPEFYKETILESSLRKMRNSTGQKIAKIIFHIWSNIEKM